MATAHNPIVPAVAPPIVPAVAPSIVPAVVPPVSLLSSDYHEWSQVVLENLRTIRREWRSMFKLEGCICLVMIALSIAINQVQRWGPYNYSFNPLMWIIYSAHLINILIEVSLNPGCVKIIKGAKLNVPSLFYFFVELAVIFGCINIMMVPIVYTSLTTDDTVTKQNWWTLALSLFDYVFLSVATSVCATYNAALIQHSKNNRDCDDPAYKASAEHIQAVKKGWNLFFSVFFFVYTNWYILRIDEGLTFVTLITVNSAIINVSSEFASKSFREYQQIQNDFGAKNYVVSIFSLLSVLTKIYYVKHNKNAD
jgi:hypothetical protein